MLATENLDEFHALVTRQGGTYHLADGAVESHGGSAVMVRAGEAYEATNRAPQVLVLPIAGPFLDSETAARAATNP